jgi:hypothetical protein
LTTANSAASVFIYDNDDEVDGTLAISGDKKEKTAVLLLLQMKKRRK